MKQLCIHRVGVVENSAEIYVPEGTIVLTARAVEERGAAYLELETLEPQGNQLHSLSIKLVETPLGQIDDDFRHISTVRLAHVGRSRPFAVFVKENNKI